MLYDRQNQKQACKEALRQAKLNDSIVYVDITHTSCKLQTNVPISYNYFKATPDNVFLIDGGTEEDITKYLQ